ncbi:hypothetical protein HYW21_04530 [Candidatus Woesearchaeota archaeon]|nr:hypothetical protein [Candidatus Woesearchaeota archaeon]
MGRKHRSGNKTIAEHKHRIAPIKHETNGTIPNETLLKDQSTAKKEVHIPITTVKHIDVPLDETLLDVTRTLTNNKLFHDVHEDVHFVLMDGRRLKNLLELVDALDTMGDDIYHHHVNESRNDFYNWIHDVYHEIDLANQILENPGRHHLQKSIMRHMLRKIQV